MRFGMVSFLYTTSVSQFNPERKDDEDPVYELVRYIAIHAFVAASILSAVQKFHTSADTRIVEFVIAGIDLLYSAINHKNTLSSRRYYRKQNP